MGGEIVLFFRRTKKSTYGLHVVFLDVYLFTRQRVRVEHNSAVKHLNNGHPKGFNPIQILEVSNARHHTHDHIPMYTFSELPNAQESKTLKKIQEKNKRAPVKQTKL